jgi:peptide/nickel transport system substrate-binding protein
LTMATDFNSIVRDYYGGNAEVVTTTTTDPEFKDMHVGIKDLPQNVRDLYTYNPTKAKQMLAEAGYPNGFPAQLICSNAQVDILSIYKDNWAKVGVNLTLDVKETTVWTSIRNAASHTQMIFGSHNLASIFFFPNYVSGTSNLSIVNDPKVNQAYTDVWENFLDWDKKCKIVKDITPYLMEQCFFIQTPAYQSHNMWQPWIMGYHGEYGTGNSDLNTFSQYVWLNLDLKEKITGTR